MTNTELREDRERLWAIRERIWAHTRNQETSLSRRADLMSCVEYLANAYSKINDALEKSGGSDG